MQQFIKSLKLSVLIVFFFCVCAAVNAQDSPKCASECDAPWTEDSLVDVYDYIRSKCSDNNLCKFSLHYRYRNACGRCEFEILKFTRSAVSVAECECTDMELFNDAVTTLVLQGPPKFCPPGTGGCYDNIHVFMGSCGYLSYESDGRAVYRPCPGVVCCEIIYQVCPSKNPLERAVVSARSNFPNEDCKATDPRCETWCNKFPAPETYPRHN